MHVKQKIKGRPSQGEIVAQFLTRLDTSNSKNVQQPIQDLLK